MILGVGVDLAEVPRFERPKRALLERLFTEKEQKYCASKPRAAIHLAGRFAAKEAFLKALGTGYSNNIGWKEIEIVHRPNGQVSLQLSGVASRYCKRMRIKNIHLSISHTHTFAVAVVVVER
jgi:holo-[acyl-carrier protein] synthase